MNWYPSIIVCDGRPYRIPCHTFAGWCWQELGPEANTSFSYWYVSKQHRYNIETDSNIIIIGQFQKGYIIIVIFGMMYRCIVGIPYQRNILLEGLCVWCMPQVHYQNIILYYVMLTLPDSQPQSMPKHLNKIPFSIWMALSCLFPFLSTNNYYCSIWIHDK